MKTVAAAITMVRDDPEFLRLWIRHYGEALGIENCFVLNHGREDEVAEIAQGANVIGIPGEDNSNFDARRWRLMNGFVNGLQGFYDYVLVGDVDELVVVDPEVGQTLPEYLSGLKRREVYTPIGLEVIHRPDLEPEPIAERVIGPRRHVRIAQHYSKPCIYGIGATIARGGHYSTHPRLNAPNELYLLHLKYCDFDLYRLTGDRRVAMTDAAGTDQVGVGGHWMREGRGDDHAVFAAFDEYELRESFRLNWLRREMRASWQERERGLWHFMRKDYPYLYRLPERFIGVV